MSKKALSFVLLWVLLLSLCSQSVSALKVTIPNQEHLIMETVDEPASLDPAWAIDTASRALIFNVYDTLVFFDREKVDEFLPYLATDWWINQPPHPFAPAGTNSTWYFRIRGTSGTHYMEGPLFQPADPTCTYWHEIYPWYCKTWHIYEWIDNPFNPDRILSASDIIKMDRACQNWDGETPMPVNVTQTFHVDEVTTTIWWTWMLAPPTEERGAAEPEVDTPPSGPSVGDIYHQIYPAADFSRLLNITSHEDTNGNGIIDPCEQFDVDYLDTKVVENRWAHLDEVNTNIVVTELPVKFHDGSDLTTEDVEYSFERLMVMDRSGGPAWKIYGPLLGVYHADMDWPDDPTCPINLAIECNSTHVWFNLAMPFPSLPLMQILCGSWASIVNEDFCVAHGCWPSHDWMHWKYYHDPEISPLDAAGDIMMGTGPYMLDYWDHGVAYSVVAFNKDITWPTGYDPAGPSPTHSYEYWGGWPAPHCSRYLDRVTNKIVYEWGIRKSNFETGLADEVYVPTTYLPQMIVNWPTTWDEDARMRLDAEGNPEYYATGIECLPGLPTLAIDAAMFFTFDVNPASGYVGTGSFPYGIPLDFFSDARIKKAFAYSFNYTGFLEEAYWNEAVQPTSCIPEGKPYHNPDNPTYGCDPAMAASLFQEASADPTSPAYQVWELGFNMTIVYCPAGRVETQTAAMLLRGGVQDVFETYGGGPVEMGVLGLDWGAFEYYLVGYPLFKSHMPLFITGWLDEFVDPHDDVHPFMHTYGHFSRFQSYSNATVDALIELGITTPDGPARKAIYDMLQLMYFQDIPSVCLAQLLKRHWEQWWVQGWCHNPLYPGQKYFYHLWKGLDGDINGDNKVDILDLGLISGHWYPGPPPGPLGYDKIADIYPELQYVLSEDPYDAIPKVWDSQLEEWIPHPSIGAVDIYDAALVSAHWLEEVDP